MRPRAASASARHSSAVRARASAPAPTRCSRVPAARRGSPAPAPTRTALCVRLGLARHDHGRRARLGAVVVGRCARSWCCGLRGGACGRGRGGRHGAWLDRARWSGSARRRGGRCRAGNSRARRDRRCRDCRGGDGVDPGRRRDRDAQGLVGGGVRRLCPRREQRGERARRREAGREASCAGHCWVWRSSRTPC